MSTDSTMTPFLKWAGGKRWLAPVVIPLLGGAQNPYIEPFLGGGAIFFAHSPHIAQLSDSNEELVQVYKAVRDDVEELIARLKNMVISREEFERIRRLRPIESADRAARLIYLNRTAFNGLYRVNQKGEFNVPFGCKSGTKLCDETLLRKSSHALGGAQLLSVDFRESLETAGLGHVVFIDPPYTVRHNENGFRRYNERLFSWQDQLDLAAICNEIVLKGVKVVVTNAHHPDVLNLYDPELFKAWSVSRMSRMAANKKRRGLTQELLLVSRTIDREPVAARSVEVIPCKFFTSGIVTE